MKKTIKAKSTRYGLVEVVDNGASGLRYSLIVSGQIKAQSNDLQHILGEFDKR